VQLHEFSIADNGAATDSPRLLTVGLGVGSN